MISFEERVNSFLSTIHDSKIINIKPTESNSNGEWTYSVMILYRS